MNESTEKLNATKSSIKKEPDSFIFATEYPKIMRNAKKAHLAVFLLIPICTGLYGGFIMSV